MLVNTMKIKKDDAKARILAESIKLFLSKGFYGSTTNEIVRLAGVSKGTLYWHFKDKNEILNNILDKYVVEFLEVAKQKIDNCSGKFPEKFKIFYKFTTEFARDNRELLLACVTLLIEFAGSGCDIEIKMKEINNLYISTIKKLIEIGIQDGTVKKEIDPVIYARLIAGTLMGSHLQWFLNLSSYEDDPVYNKKHAFIQREELLKMLLSEDKLPSGLTFAKDN
jgi:AcrR family transcriptional regulator